MATNQAQTDNTDNTGQQQAQKISEGAKNATTKVKNVAGKAKNAAKTIGKAAKSLWNLMKAVFGAIKSFVVWLIGILGPIGTIILIVVAILAVVCVAIFASYKMVMGGGYDSSNGTMTSYFGIKGNSFYGARVIYFDNESTSNELASAYLEFTENILNTVNNYGIKLTLAPGYTQLQASQRTAKSFALKLTPEDDEDIFEATKYINHYGFTEEEKEVVLSDIATNISRYYIIKDNSNNTLENNNQAVTTAKEALQKAYDSNFGYMKNVCSKIIIKDYLLNSDDDTLTLPKQNYIASIYMPKQDVTVKEVSFIYKVDGNENVITSKLTHTNEGNKEVLVENEIDSSWYDEVAQNTQTYNKKELNLSTFTAIDLSDLNYLMEGKSLFSLIKEGTYSKYFSNTDNNYSKENLISNINSNNYLMLEFSSTAGFNFIDSEIKY